MTIGRLTGALRRIANRGPVAMALAAGRAMLSQIYRMAGKRYVTRRVHDYRMILDMQDPGLSRGLMLFRTREIDHKVMLERIVRPGMRIFDVGGNIGYYPLMELSLLAGTGELVVVEPLPHNVELLRRNLALNGYTNVPLIAAAISSVATEKTFYISKHSNLGTFHPEGSVADNLSGATLNIETLTIPILAQRYGPPDLLRMDIEGHEVEVFSSMLDGISRGDYQPTVIFETHPDRYGAEHDMAETMRRLFALGYGVPLLSTSNDAATERLIARGYKPGLRISTDATHRTLFNDIGNEDAIDLICLSSDTRTVVLARK